MGTCAGARALRDELEVEPTSPTVTSTSSRCGSPWNGVGEHTRFPIAWLRYTKSTGKWSIYRRDRNLRFHEYKRKRPTKNVQALLDHIETSGDPIFWG